MTVTNAQWAEYKNDIVKFVNDLVYVPSSARQEVIKVKLEGEWEYQAEIIREITRKLPSGRFKYSTAAICIPKQNGKTFSASLVLTWRFITHFNVQGVVASNSKDQASSVVFDTFKSMIKYSPELSKLVGPENILDKEIKNPSTNSIVTVLSSSKAAAWGYGIDIAVVDEIHAAPDDEGIYNILASQTGPRDGQIILPSQVSSQLNILYHLYNVHKEGLDPSLYFLYIQKLNPSPLVTKRWLDSRKAQLTPAQYALYHDNDWIFSTRKLFDPDKVGKAVVNGENFTAPVTRNDLLEWEHKLGTKFQIGGGLDRALPYSKHGDRTFWSTVGKGKTRGEEFWLLLNQAEIDNSLESGIKNAIMEDHDRYRLKNVVFEVYQAADLLQWTIEKGIEAELVHPVDRTQVSAFTRFHQIVNQEQLAIPEGLPLAEEEDGRDGDLPMLIKEMKEFEHEMEGKVPKFGHKPGTKYHDDSVYSLNWAIYALREQEAYEKRPRRRREGYESKSEVNQFTGR
jgi:hypothetical protein